MYLNTMRSKDAIYLTIETIETYHSIAISALEEVSEFEGYFFVRFLADQIHPLFGSDRKNELRRS